MASGDSSVSYSSSEESLEEYVDGTTLDDCDGTQPYMFEPYDSQASSGSESDSSDVEEAQFERLQNTDW